MTKTIYMIVWTLGFAGLILALPGIVLAASGGESPDPLVFDIDLAICTLIIFLVLLAVLWKFAWGPIVAGLDKREQGIADNIAAGERSRQEAQKYLEEYEKKIAEAANEVRAMVEEARRDADHTKQEILAQARSESQTERDRALREIDSATDQALKQLAEASANQAVDLAGKIIRAQLKPADHADLIKDALANFPRGIPGNN